VVEIPLLMQDGNDAKIEEVDEFSLEDLDDDSEKKEL
jgi:hypothetical protein